MRLILTLSVLLATASAAATAAAQERRAPRPTFPPQQWQRIFFDHWSDGIRGQRPPLASLRTATPAEDAAADAAPQPDPTAADSSTDRWTRLIRPASIEDEIKRLKLQFDALITTPSEFSSGGFQQARVDLSALATLLAVIHEHSGDVRWQSDAAAARDLMANTARNSKSGSAQVYNEARMRKGDLQDLLSGSGVSARTGAGPNDWTKIADRGPLMQYAEELIETLSPAGSNATSIEREGRLIVRNAELIAMLGEVLTEPGMEDADDQDYAELSRSMSRAAGQVVAAMETQNADPGAVQAAISGIRQRCDACHEQYR